MKNKVDEHYILSFGKYKGKPLSEVSNGYLEELYRSGKAGNLKQYIEENVPIIRFETEKDRSTNENV